MKNGQKITLTGKIVDFEVHQLLGNYDGYPFKENFYSDGGYYAIFFKEKMSYRGKIEIQGVVREISLTRSDDEVIRQFHILVERWKKL